MTTIVVTILHVVACLFLIGVVLLQQGKGADMGAVFGGSSSTIFGSGGAGNFLTRLTTGMAIVFMLTSLTLTYTGAQRITETVFDEAPVAVEAEPPAAAEPQVEAPAAAEPQAEAPAAPNAEAPAAEPQAAAPEAAPQPEAAAN